MLLSMAIWEQKRIEMKIRWKCQYMVSGSLYTSIKKALENIAHEVKNQLFSANYTHNISISIFPKKENV